MPRFNKTVLFCRIDDPETSWLRGRFETFNIPTEMVVAEPRTVTPAQGRFFAVDLYIVGELLYPYDELRKLPDFNGASNYTQVYLYEVWGEWGSDGHTDYTLDCWMLTPGKYKGDPTRIYNDLYDVLYRGRDETNYEDQ